MSPPNCGSTRSCRPPRPAADIRRRACRRPKSWRRCSSPRCGTTPEDPKHADNDRFVLSKGHAAPVLYAAWAEAGLFPREQLLDLRKIELRPRRAPDTAAVVRRRGYRVARSGHLRGDRHRAERTAHRLRLSDLRVARRRRDGRRDRSGKRHRSANTRSSTTCAGSSTSTGSDRARPTQLNHAMDAIAARWQAFGWNAIIVDGHNVAELLAALRRELGTRAGVRR